MGQRRRDAPEHQGDLSGHRRAGRRGIRGGLSFLAAEAERAGGASARCHREEPSGEFWEKYEGILSQLFDEVFITDGSGYVRRVIGQKTLLFSHLGPDRLVGRHVSELERQGIMKPSATLEVLRTKRKAIVIQETGTGRKLEVTAIPVYGARGEIEAVVSVCQDVTERDQLQARITELEATLRHYRELLVMGCEGHVGRQMVGVSPAIRRVQDLIVRTAATDCTVLIVGESGTGKEVAARLVHDLSGRKAGPFVKVHCAGIPEALLESELFGYERGAFTGASSSGKAGLFEMANQGTLFLDEIGDMPLPLQVKLLEFLQDHTIRKVGGTKPTPLNVRVIAATNQDLEKCVREGRFRADLYFRLNVMRIEIPPLRERVEDVPVLFEYFLAYYDRKYARRHTVSQNAVKVMCEYNWPGNVRELQNFVERLVLMVDKEVVDAHDVARLLDLYEAERAVVVRRLVPWRDAVALLEEQLFDMALRSFGTTRLAARALGVNQSTVVRKLAALKSAPGTGRCAAASPPGRPLEG